MHRKLLVFLLSPGHHPRSKREPEAGVGGGLVRAYWQRIRRSFLDTMATNWTWQIVWQGDGFSLTKKDPLWQLTNGNQCYSRKSSIELLSRKRNLETVYMVFISGLHIYPRSVIHLQWLIFEIQIFIFPLSLFSLTFINILRTTWD